MERLIYFDNSATTKPCESAIDAALSAMRDDYGNPSSLYVFGMQAEQRVSNAREILAEYLHCRGDEIIFTSCGSESNSTAIYGAVQIGKRKGKHIVTTTIEHPSVLEPIARLESLGYEITRLTPDENGYITDSQFADAIRSDTVLVSAMYVNNEVGSILPVSGLKNIIRKKNSAALLHIDCVQALGKLDIDVKTLDADLLSFSAHKLHGVKGVGALYVKKGLRLPPFLLGGGQERGFRSGTEAVPAIAAFGAAITELPEIEAGLCHARQLRDACIKGLSKFENVVVNSPENSLPYILNVSFCGYRSETILHFLEQFGICVSSGSACSKGKGSYVLREMGLSPERVDSALRLSFSRDNSLEEVEAFLSALEGAKRLRRSGR